MKHLLSLVVNLLFSFPFMYTAYHHIIIFKQMSPISTLPNIIEYFKSLAYSTFLWHLVSWATSNFLLAFFDNIFFLFILYFSDYYFLISSLIGFLSSQSLHVDVLWGSVLDYFLSLNNILRMISHSILSGTGDFKSISVTHTTLLTCI